MIIIIIKPRSLSTVFVEEIIKFPFLCYILNHHIERNTNKNMFSKNVDDDPFCYFPDDPDHSFHLPISFFPFPSPFDVDDHQFDEFDFMFHQKQQQQQQQQNSTPSNTNMDILNSEDKIKTKKKIPNRKRLSKKDRHSKITTASGLRDRRMRLSLPVARQFFGLQDMLGVDKPSKTVEWLLIQARPQILKLANICSPSTNVSSNSNNINYLESAIIDEADNFAEKIEPLKSDGKKKKRVIKQQQPIRKTMAKEMREMARARARARTIEKKSQDFDHHNLDKNSNKLISSCGEESGATTHHSHNLNPAAIVEVEKPIIPSQSQPIHIDFQLQNFSSNLEIMAKWSPSYSIFNYLNHQTENLDLQEQNEFEDYGIFG